MFKFDTILLKLVRKDIENGNIPMLLGEPGIGKSSWLEALANDLHTKCFTLACNQLADKADLTGARMVPVTDATGNVVRYKQEFFPHAILDEAIAYAEDNPRETPILFMDELNRTTPDVTSECLSIPTARKIGGAVLPKNLRVVIAGNDKGNITSLDEASVSRFVLYHVTPDVNTFLGLDPNLNAFIRKTLQAHPETIFGKKVIAVAQTKDDDKDDDTTTIIEDIFDEADEMAQIATPRTISGLSRFLNGFNNQELMQLLANVYTTEDGDQTNSLQEAIEGHTGKTQFTTYLMMEIASGVATASSNAATNNVPKPQCYDQLKACPDMTTMNSFVSSLSNSEKGGCLVYALYEKEDNRDVIIALAPQIPMLEGTDSSTLMKLKLNDQLDQDNVSTFVAGQSSLAKQLSVILGA